ncbi:serine hydrolase domain-containing protein [Nocardiopsis coralliicola]
MDVKRWAATTGAAALAVAAAVVAVHASGPSADAGPAQEAAASQPPPEPPRISSERRVQLQQALNEVIAEGSSGAVAELVEHNADGSDTWNGVAGVSDRETRDPVDPNAHFRIASLSKPFVAATALKLVEQGTLNLGDTLEDMLPGLVGGGDQITLRMLLSHTSGLYSYNGAMPSVTDDPGATWEPEDLVEIAEQHGPVFAPGSSVEYSNTNYVLVAMAIERATGRPYPESVQRLVLDPVGLEETSIPGDSAVPDPVMRGYAAVSDHQGGSEPFDVTEFDPSRWYGTAQVVSTVSDVNRFWRALLDGEVLSGDMLDEMLTVQAVDDGGKGYGFALGPRSYTLSCGAQVWMHPGNIPGHRTWTVHGDDLDFTLFQARYSANPDPPAWSMIELAMCPEAPLEPDPSPSTGDYPSEDVGGTGRGEDGGR